MTIFIQLEIWDVGGQSIASPMLEKYINGANGAVIVYDVTNSTSFENLGEWINVIKKFTNDQEKVNFLNKIFILTML